MAKFCGKCGSVLDEVTGKCPKCASAVEKTAKANDAKAKEEKKTAPRRRMKKSRLFGLIAVLALIIAGVVAVVLMMNREEPIPPVEIPTVDPDNYFENNATVQSTTDAKKSDRVRTGAQVVTDFGNRGFVQHDITADYSMDGEYLGTVIVTAETSDKHPMYQTFYTAGDGMIWSVFEINGTIMATIAHAPSGAQLPIDTVYTESATVMSYDSSTNKFYETVPNADVMKVVVVERLDSNLLETIDPWAEEG